MSRPWMPLYIADYLRDTTHLQAAESGAYLHLIMAYWSAGKLPNDDRQLSAIAKMTPRQWKTARPMIEPFFGMGFTSHKRIDRELAEATAKYERRAAAGKAGGEAAAKGKQTDSNAPALLHQLQLPSDKEESKIAADAASTGNGKYAFESGIIRLTAKDFAKWQKAFSYLDLAAELISLTRWAEEQGPENWFFAVSGALAKRNRDVKHRTEIVKNGGPQLLLTPSGEPWPEGIT